MARTVLATAGALTHDILGHRVASRYVLKDENCAFGVVVVRVDGEDTGANPADKGTKPIGISIKKNLIAPTCDNPDFEIKGLDAPYGNKDPLFWKKGECISILEEGSVCVRVFEDVAIGDPVKYTDAGDATVAVDGKTKIVGMCGNSGADLPDAVYETSSKAWGYAIVRINK